MSLNRRRAFTICEILVTAGVLVILGALVVQGGVWLRCEAEAASLVVRSQHLGTSLQLYYQKHRTYPDAYPAQLEQDLAPYIDDEAALESDAHEGEGAAPLNAAYVTPVRGDANSYVLGLDSRFIKERAVVLFANGRADIVEKMPVFHNDGPAEAGDLVVGGVIRLGNGSRVRLGVGDAVRIVQSFTADDGTAFNIVKVEDKGEAVTLTATAGDTDIIEIGSEPGLVFMRNGTAEAEIIPDPGSQPDGLKVSTYSGDVRVIGRMAGQGHVPADEPPPPPEYEIDPDQNIVPAVDCIATITVLGKAITWGAGGPDVPVQTGASVVPPGGDQAIGGSLNINPNNSSDFEFVLTKPDGSIITRDDLHDSNGELTYAGQATLIRVKPKGNGNQNSITVNGQPYSVHNGDVYIISSLEMTVDLRNTNEGGNGHWWIDINANNALICEEGSSEQYNWQWLFGGNPVEGGESYSVEVPAGTRLSVKGRASYSSWSREYTSVDDPGQVLVLRNGDAPPEFDPFDGQPEITEFCAPIIDEATGLITIQDHQAVVLFELGTTNRNSAAFDMQDLVLLVDFALAGSPGDSGEDDPPPEDDDEDEGEDAAPPDQIMIGTDGTITVNEDTSLAVRVLGTTLKNENNQSVPIKMKLKVNDTWYDLRNGNKVKKNYRYKKKIYAGEVLALKAISCNGAQSTAYHTADGTGHAIGAVADEVPEPFAADPPVEINEGLLSRAVDVETKIVTLAPHQLLVIFELGHEDLSDPDVTYQDVAAVMTFMPKALHSQNKNSTNFDGYQSDCMGEAAQAFADQYGFAWVVGRMAPDDDPSDPDDGGSDDGEPDEPPPPDDDDETGGTPVETEGSTTRTLYRGIPVPKGRSVTVTRRW